jgi:hypothetical protein
MSAYVIGHMTVKDDDKWAEYRRQVLVLWNDGPGR